MTRQGPSGPAQAPVAKVGTFAFAAPYSDSVCMHAPGCDSPECIIRHGDPCPPDTVEEFNVPSIGSVLVRALTLADKAACRTFSTQLEHSDIRARFFVPVALEEDWPFKPFLAHRHGTAFAAFGEHGEILGIAHLVCVSGDEAEVALLVRSDRKRRGLGRILLGRMVRYGVVMGIACLHGQILRDNAAMLHLARHVGFSPVGSAGVVIKVRLNLTVPPSHPDRTAPDTSGFGSVHHGQLTGHGRGYRESR